jgi:hypothetical protein
LQERQVHGDVLLFCRAELLQDNYFHAVFEATKSVAGRLLVPRWTRDSAPRSRSWSRLRPANRNTWNRIALPS